MVTLSYLTPVNQDKAMSKAFPSSPPDNGFNQYAAHQQQLLFVNEPSPFDILLGKEKAIFNHSGNRRFRTIINSHLSKYTEAPTKSSKSKLIRQVHADMQKAGYRFLRRNDTSKDIWCEIEKHEVREKVSHALRDRVREQQKPSKRRRKTAACAKSPSPTSIVSIKDISLEIENEEDTKAVVQKEQKKQQPLNIPTLRNDGLTLNQPFSRDYFEIMTSCRDDTERRVSLLSKDDDHHAPLKAKGPLSLVSINDSSSKPQLRRLSLLSLDDMSCAKATRRLSMFSTDSAVPSQALRRSSLVGIFDIFSRYTNSGDNYASCSSDLEPYSLDDEFEPLEMDHVFSTHLGTDEDDFDTFHNMSSKEVDDYTAACLVEIACAL
jgi:hypothetical protein